MNEQSYFKNGHHILSPSAASRWMNCPGSVDMSMDIEEQPSEFAAEGTKAHELAERCLNNNIQADSENEEMNEYVNRYLDYVHSIPGQKFIEMKVDLSSIMPFGSGTADVVAIGGNTLHIIDLKYGKGVKVFSESNPQLMIYAAGAIDMFELTDSFEQVKLHIAQPRLDHFDAWQTGIGSILDFKEKAIKSAKNALSPGANLNPGEKQCRFCPARIICRARSEHLINQDFPDDFRKLSIDELSEYKKRFSQIKNWISEVDSYLLAIAKKGGSIPGFKLVAGRSNRKWIDTEQAIIELSGKVPDDILFKKSIAGIPAVEKALGKEKDILKKLIHKPEGAPTLAPADDKRAEISIGDDFSDFDD